MRLRRGYGAAGREPGSIHPGSIHPGEAEPLVILEGEIELHGDRGVGQICPADIVCGTPWDVFIGRTPYATEKPVDARPLAIPDPASYRL
jgi:hypothetical protein